jgi:putative transposase
VARTLTRIAAVRDAPRTIKSRNGSEFISKVMDRWACENHIELDFSRPGKPTDKAKVESINGQFRAECPNSHRLLSLADTQRKIQTWRQYQNEARPHSALAWSTRAEYARRARLSAESAVPPDSEISTFGQH